MMYYTTRLNVIVSRKAGTRRSSQWRSEGKREAEQWLHAKKDLRLTNDGAQQQKSYTTTR